MNGANDAGGVVMGMMLFILAFIFYLLPTIIAEKRKTHNKSGIALLNIFTGWTVIGWFAAFILACASVSETSQPERLESASAADEIHKLANLAEKGLISKDEFEAQKKKILQA